MSSEVLPYWYQLLRHFENKGYIHNGLTIPFLIGALEVLEPDSQLWTVEELTESLNNNGCTILKCSYIGEFVIGSLDDETLKIKNLYHCLGEKILVTDSSLDNIGSVAELESLFNEQYQTQIINKEFSKSNGTWAYFTETDKMRINEIE